jgi:lipopolysaccharide export LptBFGC system permease protein LptF
MKIPFTLSRYLIKKFFITFVYLCLFLGVIIGIFELIDATKSGYSTLDVLKVVTLNIASKIYGMIIYTSLGASVVLFYQMRQNKELTAYKHLGFSNHQVFFVFVFMITCFSIIDILVLNPNVNRIDHKSQQLETKGDMAAINLSNSGIWLKDTDRSELRYLHAEKMLPKENAFEDVNLLILNRNGQLNSYWKIKKAILEKHEWHFVQATNLEGKQFSSMFKKTILKPSDLKIFARQMFVPFIKIPSQIKLFHKLNLATDYYRLLWHKFLIQYLFCIVYIMMGFLIATSIYNTVYMFMATLFTGLSLFFVSELIINYLIAYHVDKFYCLWIFPSVLFFLIWKRL